MQSRHLRWLVAFLLLPACGADDPGEIQADISWQVRCEEAGGCAGYQPRTIVNIDGEAGHRVSCTVQSSGDNRLLSFQAYKGTEYGIEVDTAAYNAPGGPIVGTACTVKVTEGGNAYEGKCSGAQPSTDIPCQMKDITVTETESGPAISGTLFCFNLPLRVAKTDLSRAREVTAPGGDSLAPASFEFTNCRGI